MGDALGEALRVGFDRSIKLEFHGPKVTSDGGLVTYRDLDGALQLTAMATEALTDSRAGDNIQRDLVASLRQSVFSRLAGYEDTNLTWSSRRVVRFYNPRAERSSGSKQIGTRWRTTSETASAGWRCQSR